jgi:hypothetical protein
MKKQYVSVLIKPMLRFSLRQNGCYMKRKVEKELTSTRLVRKREKENRKAFLLG